jgi:hypothetical protein
VPDRYPRRRPPDCRIEEVKFAPTRRWSERIRTDLSRSVVVRERPESARFGHPVAIVQLVLLPLHGHSSAGL